MSISMARPLFGVLLGLVAGAQLASAATINGGTASGDPGTQVQVTFTLNGNGTTRSIAGVFNLPADLTFTGSPTGAVPPLQCTNGGMSWTNTGSPIPANAGTCTYTVQIAPGATPGPKSITLTQASCDNVCTFNPATITVNAPATPPSVSYNPTVGSNVMLSGGTVGGTGSAAVAVTPSGGSGSGAGATTTVGSCNVTGNANFGAPPPTLTFVGTTTTTQNLNVSCTLSGMQVTGTLTCTETAGAGGPVTRSWPLTCPQGVAANVPPALSYAPAPGSTVTLGGGAGTVGTSATGAISVSPSGGSGAGSAATTTVAACGISGPGAGQFTTPPGPATFIGSTAASQNLGLVCTRAAADANATLTCTETQGTGPASSRSWPLVCPAGTSVTPSSVTLALSAARVTQPGPVVLQWTPVNANGCVPTSSHAPTNIVVDGTNRATATIVLGTQPRNEVFTITCNGATSTVSATATLAVGVPPPPPPAPVQAVTATTANGESERVALSDGGRIVVFESTASNLVANDTNGQPDVFVRNFDTGTLTRISVQTNGTQLPNASGEVAVSRDGTVVAFTNGTPGAAKTIANGQICLVAPVGGYQCVSKAPGGAPGNGSSNNPALSGDGSVLVFDSTSTNLTAATDGNGSVSDVFAQTVATGETKNLSLTNAGVAATAKSTSPAIACSGKSFAYESEAKLTDTNVQSGVRNIYAGSLNNLQKGLVTIGMGGVPANGNSSNAAITDDGRFVFFESLATNLVPNDTNGVADVFVADRTAGTITRVSVSASAAQGNGESRRPKIPCDGAYVTFESKASNLVPDDGNGREDTFVRNMGTGSITIVSQVGGDEADGESENAAISPDGTSIGFDSDSPRLGGDNIRDVFAGGNPFAQQNYTGAWFDPNQAGHGIFLDQLADGRLVAWWFTFDPSGNQAWFGGTGPLQGNTATIDVVRTEGARFMPNFVSSEARNTPIGTLTFTFTSCTTGRVDFALDSTFGRGFMNLTRLSLPVGVACGGTGLRKASSLDPTPVGAKAVEPTRGPIAGVTGAWFDPTQPGQGLFFENLGDRRLLAWWFSYGPNGGQAWFGGVGTIVSSTRAEIDFVKTQGGRWIPNFNPANVTNPALGRTVITFSSCSNGRVDYTYGEGFGTGSFVIQPLIRAVGTACSE